MSTNRTEFCALLGDEAADQNPRWDAPVYVRRKFVTVQRERARRGGAWTHKPKHLWVRWRADGDSYSTEVAFEKPEEDGYKSYLNYDWVDDGNVELQPCEYYMLYGDRDICAGTILEWDSVDFLAGHCTIMGSTSWRLIHSRGDAALTAEQVAAGDSLGVFHAGVRNFSHNPSHAMLTAVKEVQAKL